MDLNSSKASGVNFVQREKSDYLDFVEGAFERCFSAKCITLKTSED